MKPLTFGGSTFLIWGRGSTILPNFLGPFSIVGSRAYFGDPQTGPNRPHETGVGTGASYHHVILYYMITLLYYTILYYTILYYTIRYCSILYSTILYSTILYSTIYSAILYYAPFFLFFSMTLWIQHTAGGGRGLLRRDRPPGARGSQRGSAHAS